MLQKQGAANAPKGGQATKLAPPPAKGKAPAAKGGVDKAKKAESASSTPNVTPAPTPPPAPPRPTTSVRHPPIIGKEELSDDTYAYYTVSMYIYRLTLNMTFYKNYAGLWARQNRYGENTDANTGIASQKRSHTGTLDVLV